MKDLGFGNVIVVKNPLNLFNKKINLENSGIDIIYPDYVINAGGVGVVCVTEDRWTGVLFGKYLYFCLSEVLAKNSVTVKNITEMFGNGGTDTLPETPKYYSYKLI
jgi:glutamate dehydrogenase/leucine dehydrogenase